MAERPVRTVTGQPGSPPVMMEDAGAAHQVMLILTSQAYATGYIAVSCTCLARLAGRGRPRQLIEARRVFPAPEALASWRAWHAKGGTEL
jgi:hypothetical protein